MSERQTVENPPNVFDARSVFVTYIAPEITTRVVLNEGKTYSGQFMGLAVRMRWDDTSGIWVPNEEKIISRAKIARTNDGENYIDRRGSALYNQKGSALLASRPPSNAQIGVQYYPSAQSRQMNGVVSCTDYPFWLLTWAEYIENPSVFDPHSRQTAALVICADN